MSKRIIGIMLAVLAALSASACTKPNEPDESVTDTETQMQEETKMITIANKAEESEYCLVIDIFETDVAVSNILQVRDAVYAVSGKRMEIVHSTLLRDSTKYAVLFGKNGRESSEKAYSELSDNEYIIRFCPADDGGELVVAYNGAAARMCAVDRLVDEFVSPEGFIVPEDLDIKGTCRESDVVTVTSVPRLRDPFILRDDDGTFYMYGTGWNYYKADKVDGFWKGPYSCVTVPSDATADFWAPEVHKYGGSYYMFTTYRSAKTGHRGCTILKSASPEGPFVEITDGHITPKDWDSIDGTFYIDDAGKPWMIFVHEWTSMSDKIGRMAAAPLSDDLTHFTAEPIELFGAKDSAWARQGITDGCFMYKASDGKLWMLWSNFDSDGYCVAMAYSDDGTITGKWKQESRRLYSKGLGFKYDGGHGMLFVDADGRLKLAIHSPNSSSAGRNEAAVIIPVTEQYGKLVLDFWQDNK